MIIRRKKNCKIIYYNKNYYLSEAYFFKKYKDKREVYQEYENYKKVILPKKQREE